MKLRLVFLVAILLSAVAANATFANENTIVPGKGTGPARLGDNVSDLIKVLGVPTSTGVIQTPGTTRYRWYNVVFTSTTTSDGSGH